MNFIVIPTLSAANWRNLVFIFEVEKRDFSRLRLIEMTIIDYF